MKTHALKKDGEVKFKGTEDECYIKLLKSQSQSTDWAIKYNGWSITELNNHETELEIEVFINDELGGRTTVIHNGNDWSLSDAFYGILELSQFLHRAIQREIIEELRDGKSEGEYYLFDNVIKWTSKEI